MRPLPPPPFSSFDVFSLCLAGTTDATLLAKLTSIQPVLEATAKSYDAQGLSERLDLMSQVNAVGAVTKDELVGLYSSHLSATKGAARTVYDHIRNSTPHKKCPLCGVGVVAVLDHHLPKAKYPDLSVVPRNLVPACHFCNDTKKARFPKHAGEQTLHPYYDARLINSRWVKGTIIYGSPMTLAFSAAPPATWSVIDQQRVARHFRVCGLGIVFGANANDELAARKATLQRIGDEGGPPVLKSHLLEQASHYSSRPNCWQLSMYEALAADTVFLLGGYNAIA